MTPPENEPEQLELSPEELALQEHFESEAAPPSDNGPVTDGSEGEDAGDQVDPPASTPPARFDLAGQEMALEEAEAMRDMYRFLVSNPDKLRTIDAYMRGEINFEQAQQQVQAPVEDPLEGLDPALRERFESMEQMQSRLDRIDAERGESARATAASAVAKGMELFQARHGLTDEDMTELEQSAAALGILPQLAQQRGDMIAGVEATLDVAYWQNPKFRDREISRQKQADSQDRRRQQKAGALAGGSGSNPRASQQFDTSTREGREAATVAAFEAAMKSG